MIRRALLAPLLLSILSGGAFSIGSEGPTFGVPLKPFPSCAFFIESIDINDNDPDPNVERLLSCPVVVSRQSVRHFPVLACDHLTGGNQQTSNCPRIYGVGEIPPDDIQQVVRGAMLMAILIGFTYLVIRLRVGEKQKNYDPKRGRK